MRYRQIHPEPYIHNPSVFVTEAEVRSRYCLNAIDFQHVPYYTQGYAKRYSAKTIMDIARVKYGGEVGIKAERDKMAYIADL